MVRESLLVRRTLFVSLLLLVLMWVLPIWRILPLAEYTPFIALHYNIYLGVDRFGPVWQILLIPMLGTVFFFLNLFVEARAYRTQKTLAYFFAAATPLLELILLGALILIVLINL